MLENAVCYKINEHLISRYTVSANDHIEVFCLGVIVYTEGNKESNDLIGIGELALQGDLNFNALSGFYKIIVLDKSNGRIVFWGDHSGSQAFYYSQETGKFADTLPDCIRSLTIHPTPCMPAILQYFSIGRTVDDTTIVAEVKKTNKTATMFGKMDVSRSSPSAYCHSRNCEKRMRSLLWWINCIEA